VPQKGINMSTLLTTFAFYAKATVYLILALTSVIVGGFFAYLGFTGSWDVITIIFTLTGLIGVGMVATLLPLMAEGVPQDVVRIPSWADGDPRFDANAYLDDNEEPITDFSNVSYEDELRAEIRAFIKSRENSKSGTEYRYHTHCIHMLQRKLDEYLEKSWD